MSVNTFGRVLRMTTWGESHGPALGAVVECVATGVPAGWGAPIYAKLDADLASAMMGINAVKGVELGIDRRAPARGHARGDAFDHRTERRTRQPRLVDQLLPSRCSP